MHMQGRPDSASTICPAGIAYKGNTFGADEAQQTIATNFLGTKAVCEALLPLMGNGGRIVNVSST